ncbi:MAG: zinc ribbon domain-containing protein [Methanobacteriota archaeon]|nr:MAG: zinc ribbon domain-containing protein [Euryarchaeota archaeon]
MARCTHCEARNPGYSRYCTICGRPMTGVQQIEPQQVSDEGGLRCHKCGTGNPRHSVFCNACGYYLKKRVAIAILLTLTVVTIIAASLLIVFKDEWLWWLIGLPLIGFSVLRGVFIGLFGLRGERLEEWKARRRRKGELTES